METVLEPGEIDARLRQLRPIEEKVVRLAYGIGCQRAHSVQEIAGEFGVGAELVREILEESERRLRESGVSRVQLGEAAAGVTPPRCRPRRPKP